jgi:large subunit ribosomal protein L29
MATTKINEFSELTPLELEAKLRDLREELFNLRLQKTTGQLENTARIRLVRRDIARAKTFLNTRGKQD